MTEHTGLSDTSSAPATLADLPVGQAGVVVALDLRGAERRRLLDLGLVPGTVVVAEMRSPLGDPVAYRVRGASVALRAAQARKIQITYPDNITPDIEANRCKKHLYSPNLKRSQPVALRAPCAATCRGGPTQ